jgi:hypothetical protein
MSFMRLKGSWIVTLIFSWVSLSASPLLLIEQLRQATVGDYLVTQQGRNSSLLLVRSVDNHRVVFEEITLPFAAHPANTEEWRVWLAQGAPHHTCWIAYLLNIQTGRIEHTYSYSQRGWINARQADHLFSTLMTLPFTPVPPSHRKRVGPPSLMGKEELRRPWNPPLVYEGVRQRNVDFTAYEATWPKDQSPLAGSRVTIYLPAFSSSYLSYFPYWIEAQANSYTIRVVDTGRSLTSPQPLPTEFLHL